MRAILPALFALCAVAAPARAAAPVRLVEAFTTADFDKSAVIAVTAKSVEQRADPAFNLMASCLGEALTQAGLTVQQDAKAPDAYVTFEYAAFAIPFFRQIQSAVNDPTDRALVVTAIAAKPWVETKTLKLLWQVVVEQTGVSNDADRTIPVLIEAAVRYYGRNLTKPGLGADANCAESNGVGTGSHITGRCTAFTPTAAR